MTDESTPSPVAGTHWKSAVEAQRAAQSTVPSTLVPSVFLSIPNTGQLLANQFASVMNATILPKGERPEVTMRAMAFSAVTGNFNLLWNEALNLRRRTRFNYYAMMHQDISTIPGWLDIMISEMVRTGADVLSVVTPIKDPRLGVTSTGILRGGEREGVHRLTLKEIHEELPETFSIADLGDNWKGTPTKGGLAVNNSLWMCRFDQAWVQDVVFTMTDWMRKEPIEGEDPWVDDDGIEHGLTYHMGIDTDDWKFSRWCHRKGLKVMATRKVPLAHIGPYEYRNDEVWGDWETEQCLR